MPFSPPLASSSATSAFSSASACGGATEGGGKTLRTHLHALRDNGFLDAETYAEVIRLCEESENGDAKKRGMRVRRSQSTVVASKPALVEQKRNSLAIPIGGHRTPSGNPYDVFCVGLTNYLRGDQTAVEKAWHVLFAHHHRINTVMTAFYVVVIGMVMFIEWGWERVGSIIHMVRQMELVYKTSHTVPVPKYKHTFLALLSCLYYRTRSPVVASKYSWLHQTVHDRLVHPNHTCLHESQDHDRWGVSAAEFSGKSSSTLLNSLPSLSMASVGLSLCVDVLLRENGGGDSEAGKPTTSIVATPISMDKEGLRRLCESILKSLPCDHYAILHHKATELLFYLDLEERPRSCRSASCRVFQGPSCRPLPSSVPDAVASSIPEPSKLASTLSTASSIEHYQFPSTLSDPSSVTMGAPSTGAESAKSPKVSEEILPPTVPASDVSEITARLTGLVHQLYNHQAAMTPASIVVKTTETTSGLFAPKKVRKSTSSVAPTTLSAAAVSITRANTIPVAAISALCASLIVACTSQYNIFQELKLFIASTSEHRRPSSSSPSSSSSLLAASTKPSPAAPGPAIVPPSARTSKTEQDQCMDEVAGPDKEACDLATIQLISESKQPRPRRLRSRNSLLSTLTSSVAPLPPPPTSSTSEYHVVSSSTKPTETVTSHPSNVCSTSASLARTGSLSSLPSSSSSPLGIIPEQPEAMKRNASATPPLADSTLHALDDTDDAFPPSIQVASDRTEGVDGGVELASRPPRRLSSAAKMAAFLSSPFSLSCSTEAASHRSSQNPPIATSAGIDAMGVDAIPTLPTRRRRLMSNANGSRSSCPEFAAPLPKSSSPPLSFQTAVPRDPATAECGPESRNLARHPSMPLAPSKAPLTRSASLASDDRECRSTGKFSTNILAAVNAARQRHLELFAAQQEARRLVPKPPPMGSPLVRRKLLGRVAPAAAPPVLLDAIKPVDLFGVGGALSTPLSHQPEVGVCGVVNDNLMPTAGETLVACPNTSGVGAAQRTTTSEETFAAPQVVPSSVIPTPRISVCIAPTPSPPPPSSPHPDATDPSGSVPAPPIPSIGASNIVPDAAAEPSEIGNGLANPNVDPTPPDSSATAVPLGQSSDFVDSNVIRCSGSQEPMHPGDPAPLPLTIAPPSTVSTDPLRASTPTTTEYIPKNNSTSESQVVVVRRVRRLVRKAVLECEEAAEAAK